MPTEEYVQKQHDMHCELWKRCEACPIADFAFQKVFYFGSHKPKYLFVGEGPGVAEDALGEPFVGPSGRLLREALDLLGFKKFAFTNLVACRPTDKDGGPNRAPNLYEMESCDDRLRGTIKIVKPKLLVGVGKVPAQWLSDNYNLPMRAIKHPAWILRQGGRKSEAWKPWLNSIKELKEGT